MDAVVDTDTVMDSVTDTVTSFCFHPLYRALHLGHISTRHLYASLVYMATLACYGG
jgi:hypothetical protein